MHERHQKALIYLRVSDDPSGRGLSVASQEAECRQDCLRHGFEVAYVLKDPGISASRYGRKTRPEYQRALELIPSVDAFVTWEASRTSRDMAEYMEFARLCQEHGVVVCYAGRIRDLTDPDDEFSAGMDALLAQRESAYISKRVRRGIRWQIKEGRPHGPTKWGYRREYDPHTKNYVRTVEDPETAPIIREMVRRLLTGESKNALARDLTRRGIRTPTGKTEWRASHIHSILRTPTYAGLREHNGQVVGAGEWPAIIREDDWALLREQFRNGRRFAQDSTAAHLLTGIALCGVCGSPVRRTVSSSGVHGYTCRTGHCVFRKQEFVDDIVQRAVVARLSDPRFAEVFRVEAEPGTDDSSERLASLRERLEQVYDDGAAGTLSSTALVKIERRLLDQIAELESVQNSITLPPELDLDAIGPGAEEWWQSRTLKQKRAVIRAVVAVTILRATPKRGQGGPDPHGIRLKYLGG